LFVGYGGAYIADIPLLKKEGRRPAPPLLRRGGYFPLNHAADNFGGGFMGGYRFSQQIIRRKRINRY
jgi:hypothetical protein